MKITENEIKEPFLSILAQAITLPKRINTSWWADSFRIIDSKVSAEPGQWKTARTPYLREIMDAFSDDSVEKITLMMSTQIGKTEAMNNMLGYAIDQDPGPAMFVLPTIDLAKAVSEHRIRPMIDATPKLSQYIPIMSDDMTKTEFNLKSMDIRFVGSNSPAGLASRPTRYVFFDEVDKYPKFSGREADPIKLGTERTRTFWNRKIIEASTPTTPDMYIAREYDKSDRRRFYVPCPHCGTFQVLVWPQIKFPSDERDTEKIKKEKLAWYECIDCGQRIDDGQKHKALDRGVWCPDGCEVNKQGEITGDVSESSHRGYWISALYSPWLTWSDIAAEFLDSEPRPETLMNFVNSWLAQVWEEKIEDTEIEKVKTLTLDYPEGVVPEKCLVLTGAVDVQKDYFVVGIRGWGIGEESFGIRALRVESWEDVEAILFKTEYEKENGEKMLVRLALVDSGFRTDEVYDFTRKWRDVARPIKGRDRLSAVPYRSERLDRYLKTGAIPKYSLMLWHIDTSFYKDKVTRMVQSSDSDLARWHNHRDISEEYLKQFCSEHKVAERDNKGIIRRYVWKKKSSSARNEYWDVEVYATAAADMLRVSSMRSEGQAVKFNPRPERRENSFVTNGREWNQSKSNWMRR